MANLLRFKAPPKRLGSWNYVDEPEKFVEMKVPANLQLKAREISHNHFMVASDWISSKTQTLQSECGHPICIEHDETTWKPYTPWIPFLGKLDPVYTCICLVCGFAEKAREENGNSTYQYFKAGAKLLTTARVDQYTATILKEPLVDVVARVLKEVAEERKTLLRRRHTDR